MMQTGRGFQAGVAAHVLFPCEHRWRRAASRFVRAMILVLGVCLTDPAKGSGTASFCADYTIQKWQTEDGLPQSSVLAIEQTPDGYLWLATFGGLARFDGVRFTVFDTGNLPGLPSNRLARLFVDREGALWLITELHELACLVDGQCRRFSVADGLPPDGLHLVREDGQGRFWAAGVKNGLWQRHNGRFVPVAAPSEFAASSLRALTTDTIGRPWFNHEDSLFRLEDDHLVAVAGPSGQRSGWARHISPSRDGGLWAITPEDLRKRINGNWLPDRWPCPDFKARIVASVEDLVGNFWVATYNNGLFRFSPTLGWQHLTVDSELTTPSLRSLFCDREGNLWVGTDGGGLLQIKPRRWKMIGRREGLGIDAVHSISQDRQERIWFAGGTTKPYWLDQGVISVAIPPPQSDVLDGVWSVLPARKLSSERVGALATGPLGRLYVGTTGGGLNVFQDGRFTVYTKQNGLPDDDVGGLYVDADEVLWIGTREGGLSRFKDGHFVNYGVKHALPVHGVGPIVEDDQGYLWMPFDQGILRVSRRELNEFAAGARGAVGFVAYDRSDGLATTEVGGIQPACLRAQDGTVWFGTAKGAAFVDPKALRVNPLPPPVIIEEVRIDDEPAAEPSAAGSDQKRRTSRTSATGETAAPLATRQWSSIALLPHQRRVEFRFTGLSLTAPNKVRFRYQMEGFDPGWVENGTARAASYTRLPPGAYRFRVTACNDSGLWNETGASLGVTVAPAFHQTWWFRLLVLAVVAGSAWLAFRLRLARLRELARLRGRIAGDLHDEIGSNLGGIILLSELAQQANALPPDARASLQEINVTAQRSATAMRDIVWFLNPDFDTLADMVARMREFAATLLSGVVCEFAVPDLALAPNLPLEFRRNVFLAFKEILHNIVKHAEASQVSIRIEVSGRQFTLCVQDNGCGFDAAQATSGHGLRSLRRRAAELGGQITAESSPGKGTTVVLTAMLR
ncbi:MAG: triple tyrosine motif-containing protein [Verrucomicrobia bacterium]|nr:triple tyrosine motif-containing protein [Verrucomicrobiota bacterium]